jgi:putative nucleotidyltransferase with HDIG domain
MEGLPVRARLLIGVAGGTGVALLVWACAVAVWGWAPLAGVALAVATGLLRVDLSVYGRTNRAAMTLDMFATFLVLGLFGLPWAVISLVVSSLHFGVIRKLQPHKLLFNFGAQAVSAAAAAALMGWAALPAPLMGLLGVGLYYAVNTGLVAAIMAAVAGRPWLGTWRESFGWIALPQIACAVAGYELGALVAQHGWAALTVALPLPMLHYMYSLYAKATRQHTDELEELSRELSNTLAAVIDARDAYTFGHSFQVARYSEAIALQMGYTPEAAARLRRNALLHDIGKVGIPERILFKPGRLTEDEYAIMKRHPVIGYEILKNIRPLADAARLARLHHEHWDGSGYPDGAVAGEVDLDSRIVGVADCLDTLLSDRPYRRSRGLTAALAEIDRCAGTQFDPEVVAALHRVAASHDASYFINSADKVAVAGAGILHWTPAEAPAHDPTADGIEVQGRSPA